MALDVTVYTQLSPPVLQDFIGQWCRDHPLGETLDFGPAARAPEWADEILSEARASFDGTPKSRVNVRVSKTDIAAQYDALRDLRDRLCATRKNAAVLLLNGETLIP